MTLDLRDKIQNLFLSDPNVIGSPDRNDVIKIGQRGTPYNWFCKNKMIYYC